MSAPFPLHRCGSLLILAGCAWVAGCRAPLAHSESQPAVPAESNAELIEHIADQPFVTAEAAYRAVYILWKDQVFSGGFASLRDELVNGRIVNDAWDHQPNSMLDRATVAYMVCRASGIEGGVNWWLTGLGRYAWRELQFRRIAHGGGEMALMNGGEFLGVLARAEEYIFKHRKTTGEKAELGPEPTP